MIKIIENSQDKFLFKDYPINYWLGFAFLFLLAIVLDYYILFSSPNSSTLICTKSFLNKTNCELIETSFFNKNLIHKTVTNIQKPRIAFGGRVGKIWLKTEIDIWHGIKNVYYPSSSIFGLSLYNIKQQVRLDVKKLNNFIQSWNTEQIIVIQRPIRPIRLTVRQMPSMYNIFGSLLLSLILAIPLFIPITVIFIVPITTYSFDSQKDILSIQQLIFFTVKETSYPLNKIVVTSSIGNKEEKQPSLSIKLEQAKTQTINDFKNKEEALNLLNSLKNFVPIENIEYIQ